MSVPASSTSLLVRVPTVNDLVSEPTETVSLSAATAQNTTPVAGTGSILDNDGSPSLSVSSPTVAEDGNFAQFTVSLSNPSATATTVSRRLAAGATNPATGGGVDFGSGTATNLQVSTDSGTTWTNATSATIAAGTTSVLVRTPVTNDTIDELNETFTLTATTTAGTTSNASAVGTATITDNDPTPSLALTGPATINEGAGTATYTVTLSAASGQTVTVAYGTTGGTATSGVDFTATSGTLTFAPGATVATFSVPITNDTTFEGSESYSVSLSTPTNATIGTGTTTILDNGTGGGGSTTIRRPFLSPARPWPKTATSRNSPSASPIRVLPPPRSAWPWRPVRPIRPPAAAWTSARARRPICRSRPIVGRPGPMPPPQPLRLARPACWFARQSPMTRSMS
ncbi:MAG: hypothetical protein IPN40_17535 [Uliginosibacterium sp.]|nr:hypothetical protein [Uliginosibacterium sp.]